MTRMFASVAGAVAVSLTITAVGAQQAQQAQAARPPQAPQARPAQQESFDYWGPQREMIRRGQQAIMMCNGLFTSKRTLEQIYSQELKFLPEPIGTAAGGDYVIDRARQAVAIERHVRGQPGILAPARSLHLDHAGELLRKAAKLKGLRIGQAMQHDVRIGLCGDGPGLELLLADAETLHLVLTLAFPRGGSA